MAKKLQARSKHNIMLTSFPIACVCSAIAFTLLYFPQKLMLFPICILCMLSVRLRWKYLQLKRNVRTVVKCAFSSTFAHGNVLVPLFPGMDSRSSSSSILP